MKSLRLFILSLLLNCGVYAQNNNNSADDSLLVVFNDDSGAPAEFPGGMKAFGSFISKNLKYPQLAQLLGIDGRVFVNFVIDKDGSVKNANATKCIGAGCDAAAVDVISNSPLWRPGIQQGKPVRVQYNVPIGFKTPKTKVTFKELKRSDYGFIFFIKGKIYSIDEAETLLGKSFESAAIEIAEPYSDEEHYPMLGKKETYLIKIKR